MNDPFLFKTICVGGPLDGDSITEAVGTKHYVYHRVVSGCEVLPGDCVVIGLESEVEQENYILVEMCVYWPSGCRWQYQFWLHESFHCRSVIECIESEHFHWSAYHVQRTLGRERDAKSPVGNLLDMGTSQFFSDGRFKLSKN